SLVNKKSRVEVEGGRYVQQLNQDKPIHHIVNTFTTLLMELNLMKLYERDYIDVSYSKKVNPFFSFHSSLSWAKRYQLHNTSDFKLVDRSHTYSSNEPFNEEIGATAFPTHQAFVGSVGFQARPWLKFRIRNGNKSIVNNSSPTILLDYRKGFSGTLNSDVDF